MTHRSVRRAAKARPTCASEASAKPTPIPQISVMFALPAPMDDALTSSEGDDHGHSGLRGGTGTGRRARRDEPRRGGTRHGRTTGQGRGLRAVNIVAGVVVLGFGAWQLAACLVRV